MLTGLQPLTEQNMPFPTQTVREIALHQPTAIPIFEHLGIDYCCGGNTPIAEACAVAGLDLSAVLVALDFSAGLPALPAPDWQVASLELLCAHIIVKHHDFARRELPRLTELASSVLAHHGETHPELAAIHATLTQLDFHLSEHFAKEESVLFPYIVSLERSITDPGADPVSCFGFLPDPVAVLSCDHEHTGVLLHQLRELSHNFTPPLEACPTYRSFYEGLHSLVRDFYQNMHLENNILFPRAMRMESATAFATA